MVEYKQKGRKIMKNTNQDKIIIYQPDGNMPKVSVKLDKETVWLTQKQIAELYSVTVAAINQHLKNIFETGELEKKSVIKNFLITATDGKNYETKHYNLDAIISLGYRINSKRATQFRIWATQRLREYIVKGFSMDDERLKGSSGGNYWKELLDRIRDIRSSEKVLYRQVLDLYATSVDYNPKSEDSKKFFAIVQNKLHYAANGKTASEIILERADANKNLMGMLSIGNSGIHKSDVIIAKNYLTETELKRLNNIVSAYFDIAELRAIDQKRTYMKDYISQLDKLIASMDRKILKDAGEVSKIEAEVKAYAEYAKYQVKTLSAVEKAYLTSIRDVQNKIEKWVKKVKQSPESEKSVF